jgi:hypothetical protein
VTSGHHKAATVGDVRKARRRQQRLRAAGARAAVAVGDDGRLQIARDEPLDVLDKPRIVLHGQSARAADVPNVPLILPPHVQQQRAAVRRHRGGAPSARHHRDCGRHGHEEQQQSGASGAAQLDARRAVSERLALELDRLVLDRWRHPMR